MFKQAYCPICKTYEWRKNNVKTLYTRVHGVFKAIGLYYSKCRHAYIPML